MDTENTDKTGDESTPEIKGTQDEIWQLYLQKCCEVGQIEHALEQLEAQKRQIEKNLEVTKRAVKSAAHKHNQLKSGANTKMELVKNKDIKVVQ